MSQWKQLFTALYGGGNLGPFYDPPYDSPIEQDFAWNFVKYVAAEVELLKQYEIHTRRGQFRLDFVLQRDGYRVAFECDGKNFHDLQRDEWRDAVTLGEDHVNVIYRLRGQDIHYSINECLFLIAHWEPEMFTSTGLYNLRSLVYSANLRALTKVPQRRVRKFVCDDEGHTHGPKNECREIDLERRTKHDRSMTDLYARSQELGDGDLDTIIRRATIGSL